MITCPCMCLFMLVTWQYTFLTLRKYDFVTLIPESKSPAFYRRHFRNHFRGLKLWYFVKHVGRIKVRRPNLVIIVSADVCQCWIVIRCNNVYIVYFKFSKLPKQLMISGTRVFITGHFVFKMAQEILWDLVSPKVDKLRPDQNGRHFADGIFKCIFLHQVCF